MLFWYGPSALPRGAPAAWPYITAVVRERRRTEAAVAWPADPVALDNARLHWTARRANGELWLDVVNRTARAESATLPACREGSLHDAFTGRPLGNSSGGPLDLPPYAGVVACTECRR